VALLMRSTAEKTKALLGGNGDVCFDDRHSLGDELSVGWIDPHV
jgi:hypothetical protein